MDQFTGNFSNLDVYNWHNYPLGKAGDSDIDKNVMDGTFSNKMRETAKQLQVGCSFSDVFLGI